MIAYGNYENSRRSHDIILQIIKPQLGSTDSTGSTGSRGGVGESLLSASYSRVMDVIQVFKENIP